MYDQFNEQIKRRVESDLLGLTRELASNPSSENRLFSELLSNLEAQDVVVQALSTLEDAWSAELRQEFGKLRNAVLLGRPPDGLDKFQQAWIAALHERFGNDWFGRVLPFGNPCLDQGEVDLRLFQGQALEAVQLAQQRRDRHVESMAMPPEEFDREEVERLMKEDPDWDQELD